MPEGGGSSVGAGARGRSGVGPLELVQFDHARVRIALSPLPAAVLEYPVEESAAQGGGEHTSIWSTPSQQVL